MSDLFASDKGQPVFLKAALPTRFPQDSRLNGEWDDEHNPKMPLTTKSAGGAWANHTMTLVIDIESGKVQDWNEGDVAEINNKVVDMGVYSILNKDGDEITVIEGDYVPDALQIDDEGYGDYVHITIQGDGHIKKWSPLKVQELYQHRAY
ncbi:hypothetical protein ACTXIV_02550 [Psychrobacter celer]|uniref:hypothetical protein n=1 Tax=Psychrobacter celer TaxID=306572 RepID=UPI003FD27E67